MTFTSEGSNITELPKEEGYQSIIDAALVINKWYLWIILAFGVPGNMAAIFTIFRIPHLGSFAFYAVLLAIVDTAALVIKLVSYQMSGDVSLVGCMFISFLSNFLVTFANWILVLMVVGRLIAIKFPLRVNNCGYKTSIIASTITCFILMCLLAPIISMVSLHPENKRCVVDDTENFKLTHTYLWLLRCLYSFVPFIIISISNIFIYRIIKSSFRLRYASCDITRPQVIQPRSIALQRQVMLMLSTTTFVFVLLTFPICADNVGDVYWLPTKYTREDATKYLLKQISYVFCDSNHAINFYLYFFSARKFRRNCIPNWLLKKAKRRPLARL